MTWFDYVIDGVVDSGDDNQPSTIRVLVSVHHRVFPPTSHDVLADSVDSLTATTQLAAFVDRCWNKWNDADCQP